MSWYANRYMYNHPTSDYGSTLWYWEFPQLKYWLNLLDFGIVKNFSFIINGAKLGVAAVARAPPLFLPAPKFGANPPQNSVVFTI